MTIAHEVGTVLQVTNGHVENLSAMMLYGGWTPLQDACYWRRSLYEKIGGIDPFLLFAADYDLFLRMSLHGRCRYVPAVFSAFRRHEGQTSSIHANGYQQERELCRQRERHKNTHQIWHLSLTNAYYWCKVRWRTRIQKQNRLMSRLVGTSVADLRCQNFDMPITA